MTASATLDGRIDWSGTFAALVAAYPAPGFPNGTMANTTDRGVAMWNKAGAAWVPVGQPYNYGPIVAPYIHWRPLSTATVLTFTAVITAGSTTATLAASWSGPSGLFAVTLSSAQIVYAMLTNGATTCTFYAYPFIATSSTYGPAFAVNAATATATLAGQPPLLGVANYFSVSASIGASGTAVLAATACDVPRNVIGAWTTSSTVTVAGLDYYNKVQTEAQTGTTFTGKKAFSSITSITSTAAITAATFGTGNVLGLPVAVRSGQIFGMTFNDAADAGTFTLADITIPATSSTGDVRGTYAPAGTLNGAKYISATLRPYGTLSQFEMLGVTPA